MSQQEITPEEVAKMPGIPLAMNIPVIHTESGSKLLVLITPPDFVNPYNNERLRVIHKPEEIGWINVGKGNRRTGLIYVGSYQEKGSESFIEVLHINNEDKLVSGGIYRNSPIEQLKLQEKDFLALAYNGGFYELLKKHKLSIDKNKRATIIPGE